TAGTLAAIGARFRSLGLTMTRIADAGGLGKIRTAMHGVHESFAKGKETMAPAIEGFGAIAGIGTGLGIAALAESLKSAAESIQDFAHLGNTLGVDPNALREFSQVANMQDVAWEQAKSSLLAANDAYQNVQHNIGRTTHALEMLDPELLGQL